MVVRVTGHRLGELTLTLKFGHEYLNGGMHKCSVNLYQKGMPRIRLIKLKV